MVCAKENQFCLTVRLDRRSLKMNNAAATPLSSYILVASSIGVGPIRGSSVTNEINTHWRTVDSLLANDHIIIKMMPDEI